MTDEKTEEQSSDNSEREESGEPEESGDREGIVREIGHDEFDPVGTLALVLVYFVIVVFMWVFMYFVEFLGNGPTVTG